MRTLPISKMKKITATISVFLLILNSHLYGQNENLPDAGAWTTLNFEVGLSSRASLVLTEEFRLRENFSELNLFYTNIGIDYKILKNLKTNLSFRTIQKYMDEGYFSYRHRLQWDVILKKKIKKIDLSYRHRLQAEIRDFYSSDDGYLPEWYSRSKFQIKYDLPKGFAPYAAAELRHQIRNPRNPEFDNVLHRARYQLGLDYKINSHNTIGLYYLYQHEFNIKNPQELYIAGLEYSFKL